MIVEPIRDDLCIALMDTRALTKSRMLDDEFVCPRYKLPSSVRRFQRLTISSDFDI